MNSVPAPRGKVKGGKRSQTGHVWTPSFLALVGLGGTGGVVLLYLVSGPDQVIEWRSQTDVADLIIVHGSVLDLTGSHLAPMAIEHVFVLCYH